MRIFFLCYLLLCCSISYAADFDHSIPMHDKGVSTYYITGKIDGLGAVEFMVDTGSGYMTINERTLDVLKTAGTATYVKDLHGIMADGSQRKVPVYLISQLTLGGNCELTNVEAAVFPGNTRQILGLSALKKAAPFIFSFDPPNLVLSHCTGET